MRVPECFRGVHGSHPLFTRSDYGIHILGKLSFRWVHDSDLIELDILSIIDTLTNYIAQGMYEEADALYVRTLEIGEKALNRDHPNMAM